MVWGEKPTEAQLNALFYWFKWEMSSQEVTDALKWLENNATRKQVSEEMNRIHDLKHSRKLNREECFKGDVWKDYFNSKVRKE